MAEIKFNVDWWKKNSANTLKDSGMIEELERWERACKNSNATGEHFEVFLKGLASTAKEAQGNANRALHGKTITYLKAYQTTCAKFIAALNKADGNQMADPDTLLTPAVLNKVKDHRIGRGYYHELAYLCATKRLPTVGSKKLFDRFLSKNAAMEVNLNSNALQGRVAAAASAQTWEASAWKEARDVIVNRSLTATNLADLKRQVLQPLEQQEVIDRLRKL